MQVVSQLNIDYGSFFFTKLLVDFPLASLAVSPDNTIVFISGMTIESMLKIYTDKNDPDISIQAVFNALDANTLQALRWSPLQSGDIIPFDMTVSPDGSQLITLASLHPFSQTPNTSFFAFEPSFQ